MSELRATIRYALRGLRRKPGFTVIVLTVLGAAIGLNTSLFALVDAMVFRPWPVPEPHRVVRVFSTGWRLPISAWGVSQPEFEYLADHASSFSGLLAMDVSRPCGVDLLCQRVSANYFDVLRVPMARGRGFRPEEDLPAAPTAVAVLSYGTWQARFGGDPAILSRTLELGDVGFTIVGVAAPGFSGTSPSMSRADVWLPEATVLLGQADLVAARSRLRDANRFDTWVAGRLAPGVERGRAEQELARLSKQFRSDAGLESRGVLLTGTSGFSLPEDYQLQWPLVRRWFAAVLLILLLACANVGNLQLAWAAARRREIAVRLSLGATRARVVRQLLTESLVLAIGAGGVGIAIASPLPAWLWRALSPSAAAIPAWPDPHVLAFALGTVVVSTVAFGLAPALHCTRGSIDAALRSASTSRYASSRLRRGLVTTQVALSVVLLSGAGLLLRAAQQLSREDPGFAVAAVNTLTFSLDRGDETKARAFNARLRAELAGFPEGSVGLADALPFEGKRTFASLPDEPDDRRRIVADQAVTCGYFTVLELPIVAGRCLEPAEGQGAAILVNESLARLYWPGQTPLGRSMVIRRRSYDIVGVVRDSRTAALDRVEPAVFEMLGPQTIPKVVTRDPGGQATEALRRAVAHSDPRVRVGVAPLSRNIDRWLEASRQGGAFATGLGLMALGIAAIGLGGLVAYEVQQRTVEIGIRMALGARAPQLVGQVLAYALRTAVAGLVVGLGLAAGTSGLLRSYLYGLSRFDPTVLAGVCATLVVTALVTSYIPARRATRVDPCTALRGD